MTRTFKILFVLTTSFIASCSVPVDKKANSDFTADTNKTGDNIVTADSLTISKRADGPSALFLAMTNYLDSTGYSFDTIRINKVSYFSNKNAVVFNDKVFYKITLPHHSIFHLFNSFKQGYDCVDTTKIKKNLFYKAKNIYGYFYCEKKRTDELLRDGAIEEWQFENENEADEAAIELGRIRAVVFFFTSSYITRTKNCVYVFHNRGAFDLIHRKTIKKFNKNFDIEYKYVSCSDTIMK